MSEAEKPQSESNTENNLFQAMRISSFVVVALIALFLAEKVHGRCLCGGQYVRGQLVRGQTTPECCTCREVVPRPQPKNSAGPGIAKAFKSIGDSCSCGHVEVQPAVPPRPLSNSISLQSSSQTQGCQEQTLRAPESFQGPNVSPGLVYGNRPENRPLPADAVSLSLAYQLARSLRRPVPEDQIQYGFRVQPLSAPARPLTSSSNIAEEKLWSMNRAVVELKTAEAIANSDDVEDEDDLEEKEVRSPGYLTYGDIGYCPEKYPSKTFNLRAPSSSIAISELCTDTAQNIQGGTSCGYRSGRVSVNEFRSSREHHIHRGLEDCFDEHK